ncbi:hypothetical protein BKA56DRAFT_570101 [Ilyonectria sp. MPI-CAGE-AT-0026]|nr:hypothetical protein BKA56DRAFT_570101 [Ilyonectria sp. MPI-CAGE-AT-0026]
MSGAEVLFGIGLLCNAMQIVTFGRDALSLYKHIQNERTPDPRLSQYCEDARACYDDMTKKLQGEPRPLSADEQELLKLAEACVKHTNELTTMVTTSSVPVGKHGFRAKFSAVGKGIKSIWNQKELESLEKNLQAYQSLLENRLLSRICSQNTANQMQTTESFNQLNRRLQNFIVQAAAGNTTISDLITQTTQKVEDHVTETNNHTQSVLKVHMSTELTTVGNEIQSHVALSAAQIRNDIASNMDASHGMSQYSQLLGSLKFREINERRNHISGNWPKTFAWIFGEENYSASTSQFTSDSDVSYDSDASSDSSESSEPEVSEDDILSTTSDPKITSFIHWLESDEKLYWISGKPASGKSTLMKFILESSQTTQHLQSWRPDVQLLSHFFWRPGTNLQHDVKGMLFSLLYQILDNERTLGTMLLNNSPKLLNKESHFDWSTAELRQAILYSFDTARGSYCIFLDGLDEVLEDNKLLDPLAILNQLKKLENVKICASSREEFALCEYFAGIDHLRIHQLTQGDIKRLLQERFPNDQSISPRSRHTFIRIVAERANGVFLWAILAVESLRRGIETGDSTEELQIRLDLLPSDLNRLYEDMWARLGDDRIVYQKTASLYFNLALEDPAYSIRDFPDLLEFSLASCDDILNEFEETAATISAENIRDRCERTMRNIRLRCAGLIECVPLRWGGFKRLPGRDLLYSFTETKVTFVHRTAHDFLTDTNFGRKILRTAHIAPAERWKRAVHSSMIRGRFLERRPGPGMISHKSCLGDTFYLIQCGYEFAPKNTVIEMLDLVCEWQLSGYFLDNNHWIYPFAIRQQTEPTHRRFLELLEEAFLRREGGDEFMRILDKIRPDWILDILPIVIREGYTHRLLELYPNDDHHILSHILKQLAHSDASNFPHYEVTYRRGLIKFAYGLFAVDTFILAGLVLNLEHYFQRVMETTQAFVELGYPIAEYFNTPTQSWIVELSVDEALWMYGMPHYNGNHAYTILIGVDLSTTYLLATAKQKLQEFSEGFPNIRTETSHFTEICIGRSGENHTTTFVRPQTLHTTQLAPFLFPNVQRGHVGPKPGSRKEALDKAFRCGTVIGNNAEAVDYLTRQGYTEHPWIHSWRKMPRSYSS